MLHVECRDLAAAERLLRVSVGSGFRESGINLGKKRVLVGIRTGANKLEVTWKELGLACACAMKVIG